MRYVILGGSIAGLSAVKAVRTLDPGGEVIVVTDEHGPAYYRPLIPLLIDGSKEKDDLILTQDILKQAGASISFRRAERVDTASKTVYLSGTKKLAYDRLLIATGARPIIPRIPGIDSGNMLVLRTMADAVKVRVAAGSAGQVVVIGGGMVGIKAATALRHRPSPPQVAILEKEEHILPTRLDRRGASIIEEALAREGIGVVTGTTVKERVMQGKMTRGIRLANGKILPADLIIAAVGTAPNVDFLSGSGIAVKNGVVVDERLETSCRHVYAAGDAVECRDAVTGNFFVSGLWTNAVEMGRLAGLNMAGGKAENSAFLPIMNASEVSGVPFISAGIVEPDKEFEAITVERTNSYRKVVFNNDRIVGISFVGDIRNAGVYVSMIRNRISIKRSRERFIRGEATYADVTAVL